MHRTRRPRHAARSTRHAALRTAVAVLAARAVGRASRRLGRGGGTALPGLVAERIDSGVAGSLARTLGGGRVVVTGTNGKTTTARMLADMLGRAGRAPVHNRSGSNLMRGLAATLAESAGAGGRIAGARRRGGVFEVDEATIPEAVAAIRPDVLVILNLFRDQLDRYGEVDSITALWRRALARLPKESTLVLNADDPTVATLAQRFGGRTLFFGVEDTGQASGSEHAADSRWCGRCEREYAYRAAFFWHIGHWRCPGCGDARPSPQVSAEQVVTRADSVCVAMRTPVAPLTVELPLAGLYNVYNALAATTAALALDVPPAAVHGSLAGFSAAFGRQERLRVRGRDVRVLLCKNPAGVNQVLRTLLADSDPLHLLVILNDGIADGRDISWVWDVDFELLRGRVASATASGRRAADMALRLKYAGVEGKALTPRPPRPMLGEGVPRQPVVERVPVGQQRRSGSETTVPDQAPPSLRGKGAGGLGLQPDLHRAVEQALSATPPDGRLYVLPTYTAMLEVRDLLARLAGRQRFWDQ